MNLPDTPTMSTPAAPASAITEAVWFNALWFQGLWFCAVLGRDWLLPLTVVLLALHLFLVGDKRRELRRFACVGGLGIAVDAVLSGAGIYQFAGGVLVPVWLVCLWLGFSAALSRSLVYFSDKLPLAAVAGGLVFPVNYWAGERLGAVEFSLRLPATLLIIALTWAVMLPLLYRLSAVISATGSAGGRV